MLRYYFDVKNGHRLIDPTGLERRDDQDANTQATFIAVQTAMHVPNNIRRTEHCRPKQCERRTHQSAGSHKQRRSSWRRTSQSATTPAKAR